VKIALLQEINSIRKLFSDSSLNDLKSLGEVSICEKENKIDQYAVKNFIKNSDILITSWGSPKLEREILEDACNLKLVIHAAGSVKGIITPYFLDRGIQITSAAEVLGRGVAETALGMTIASLKNMWLLSKNLHEGEWSKGGDNVKDLFDIKVGVVGAGRAGKHYIRLMKNFDVDILLHDPFISIEAANELGVVKAELEQLLQTSDIVSIHAPSIPATYKMFNKEKLALMKDGAILINTARGSIIDEEALIDELKSGRLFACLDVFDPEPPAVDHPFRSFDNVVLTPHIAGCCNNGLHRIGKFCIEEIKRFLIGQKLEGEVKVEKLDELA